MDQIEEIVDGLLDITESATDGILNALSLSGEFVSGLVRKETRVPLPV